MKDDKMKIYFGGSISGGRQFLGIYQEIVSYLQSAGHQVLTEHVVRPDVLEFEKQFTSEQIYSRDVHWLNQCDCLVAEVSNPSLGVGYEICYALRLKKPVLCLYQKGILLTRMLTGNTSPGFVVEEYASEGQRDGLIESFLVSLRS
jgi:2'-deoxynucleoside 5'-phosphate N-hydrolase